MKCLREKSRKLKVIKQIESVAPDYQYLDDVFVKIFRQDALDRLYPEDKIIMEMKFVRKSIIESKKT